MNTFKIRLQHCYQNIWSILEESALNIIMQSLTAAECKLQLRRLRAVRLEDAALFSWELPQGLKCEYFRLLTWAKVRVSTWQIISAH